jgi:hypothetical protein
VEKGKYRKTPVKTIRHVFHKGPFWLHIQKPTENQRKLNGFGLTDSIAVPPTPMSVDGAQIQDTLLICGGVGCGNGA